MELSISCFHLYGKTGFDFLPNKFDMMTSKMQKLTYNLVAAGMALLAARVVKAGMEKGWGVIQNDTPPENPEDPETSWQEALIWSAVTGVMVGAAQLLIRRGTAVGWIKFTGHNPIHLS